ncbi:hypothetical protein [Streptomyces sp. NPDC057877]|uniref:hypothetical protein n=1 Tax=Streptomyces sp. NPDC057877 TaxID=3346269 RepID=UPI00369BF47E
MSDDMEHGLAAYGEGAGRVRRRLGVENGTDGTAEAVSSVLTAAPSRCPRCRRHSPPMARGSPNSSAACPANPCSVLQS